MMPAMRRLLYNRQQKMKSISIINRILRDGVHSIIPHQPISRTSSGTIYNQIRLKSKNAAGKNRARVNAAVQSIQQEKRGGFLYGLKPVNYSSSVPPPIFRSPPPPPPKPSSKYFFPFTLVVSLGLTSYFYFFNKNDSHEYWEAMQTGGVLPGVYNEDDDDEDDDEDED